MNTTGRASVIVVAVVAAAVLLAGFGWLLDGVLGHNPVATIENFGHRVLAAAYPWRLFWISAGVALIPAAFSLRSSSAQHAVWVGVAVLTMLAGFVLSISTVNRWGHDVAHDQINRVLTVEDDAISPSYETRDPYALALARLRRSVGDASGFEVPDSNVWRFEVDGEPLTCGVKVPNRNTWKSPVRGVVCVDDTGRVREADFEGKVPSWEVSFGHLRLAQAVNDHFPRGGYTQSDVYGYIDADGPHMVVPVTRMMGGLRWHTGWVGALVFDKDGTARKVTDPSELPGPAIGESVADQVLNALSHRAGFMDSKRAHTAYDLGDGANVRHFLLERADGEGERLVTLLTPLGNSETVTAILEIDPHTVVNGWPKATLYRLDTRTDDGMSRASVDEVIDLVRQRYGTAMQLGQAQQHIMEATPSLPDELIVTVGSNQRVFARVSVNMMTRASCVYTPAGEEVRCDGPDSAPLAFGSLRELFNNGDTAVGPETGTAAGETGNEALSSLSDAELNDLLRQIADELDARRQATQPQG